MEFYLFIVLFITVSVTHSLKLPSYIKPCSKSSPKLIACCTKSGQDALPYFINGDRKYRIPKLNPLLIEELVIDQSAESSIGLKLHCRNAFFYGLEKSIVKSVVPDFKNRRFTFTVNVPKVEIITKYNVNGRILILPITGAGDGNITLVEPRLIIKVDYDLVPKGKQEKLYLKPKNPRIDFVVSRAYIKLENLFNGNKLLGDQMNRFMDENWSDIVKEIGPSVVHAIALVVNSILTSIADQVPFGELFTP